jgi:hypothetical protein
MEKLMRIAIILSAIIAGASVFYFFIIYLPKIEQQKIDKAEQERAAFIREERYRKERYRSCTMTAATTYNSSWEDACLKMVEFKLSKLNDCLSATPNSLYCKEKYKDIEYSSSCLLSKNKAESIDDNYKETMQRCLDEAANKLL